MTVRTIEKFYPDTHPGRYDRPPRQALPENLTDMARANGLHAQGNPFQDQEVLRAME